MYLQNNINQDILQDKKRGKIQPWKPKKVRNLKLADSLHRQKNHKKANRVWWCGCTLEFVTDPNGEKYLKTADFCRERLCPMCQWRRSIKVFHQVSKVMDRVEEQHKDLVPIFLTLTMRNCSDIELSGKLDEIFKGWKNFIDHRKIRKLVKGWFRALEVTYNRKDDTFHPHFHVILIVEKNYFKSKDYMETTEWVHMWRTAMGLDYDPVCDIRKFKSKKGKYKDVAEVAKYTLKDNDYLTESNDLTDKLVSILGESLKGRRLFAFGGLLKKIAKELGAEKPDEGDLVHIDEDVIREDIATIIEVYRWKFGFADYIKVK